MRRMPLAIAACLALVGCNTSSAQDSPPTSPPPTIGEPLVIEREDQPIDIGEPLVIERDPSEVPTPVPTLPVTG